MDVDGRWEPVDWVDVGSLIEWLPKKPYFVADSGLPSTIDKLESAGFRIVSVEVQVVGENIEEDLLIDLSAALDFSSLGAGSWAAFNDRLWDLLTAEDKSPVGIVVRHADKILEADLHAFVRCVHNLLSMTEGVGLSATVADRQVEYFFTGAW